MTKTEYKDINEAPEENNLIFYKHYKYTTKCIKG